MRCDSQAGLDLPLLLEEPARGVGALEAHWDQAATFAYLPAKSPVSREWVQDALVALPEPYQEDHFCLLTSGSTGNPKLVVGRKDRAERLAGVLHQVQESDPVAETLVTLPLSYCYAFVNQWLWACVAGRRLVQTPGLSQPDVLLAHLSNARDAMLCLIGPQVALLRHLFGDQQFPGVLRAHFAGGRFPQESIPHLQLMFPNALIFNNYGCAEAMPRLTLRPAEQGDAASDIGHPLPGVQLKTGAAGELLFLSEYRCVAQVDEAGFRATPDEEWIATGDLAQQCANGHWQLLGRSRRSVQALRRKDRAAADSGHRQRALGRSGQPLSRVRWRRRRGLRSGIVPRTGAGSGTDAPASFSRQPSAHPLAPANRKRGGAPPSAQRKSGWPGVKGPGEQVTALAQRI